MNFWEIANKSAIVASIIGGVAVVFAIVYYFVHLDNQLAGLESKTAILESQMLALKVSAQPSPNDTRLTQANTDKSPNQLVALCLELYQ